MSDKYQQKNNQNGQNNQNDQQAFSEFFHVVPPKGAKNHGISLDYSIISGKFNKNAK